ncbi:unnamed protein product [Oikopleura dioica]|uniref:Fork-head domain-containing protein n=1 Tax=Oikopleura dioica TaxID=34765 RepID=E4YSC6_OIKDI|nr:unnamed protein product [Oikopleura dioica]
MTKSPKSRGYRRHEKPPLSYITLIAMAIKSHSSQRATLQQINEWLAANFPFFRGEYIGWKNSVRHNLSLNDCFVKILRDPSRPWGKDNFWTIAENCSYIFDNGAFRRRRKNEVANRPAPFSIDWILSLPDSRPSSPQSTFSDSDSSQACSPPPVAPRILPIYMMPRRMPQIYHVQKRAFTIDSLLQST